MPFSLPTPTPLDVLILFALGTLTAFAAYKLVTSIKTHHPHTTLITQQGHVLSTHASLSHTFSKPATSSITLIRNLGVENDSHAGVTVQHLSRMKIKPPPANLRQVHLLHSEILDEHGVEPGKLGENITTKGVDLLGLPEGVKLYFLVSDANPSDATDGGGITRARQQPPPTSQQPSRERLVAAPCVRITGLRNPCVQIEKFRAGLQAKFVEKDSDGKIVVRKAGIMGVVEQGGIVEEGMDIWIEWPRVRVALGPV